MSVPGSSEYGTFEAQQYGYNKKIENKEGSVKAPLDCTPRFSHVGHFEIHNCKCQYPLRDGS